MTAINTLISFAVHYTTCTTTNEIIAAIDGEIAKLQEARYLLSDYSDPTSTFVKREPGKATKANRTPTSETCTQL